MKVFCEENVLNQDYLLLHQKSNKNTLCDHVEHYFYYFLFHPEETLSFSLSAHRLCEAVVKQTIRAVTVLVISGI